MRTHIGSIALIGLLALANAAHGVDRPIDAVELKLVAVGPGGAPLLEFVARDPAFLFPPIGTADDPATGLPGGLVVDLFTPSLPGPVTIYVPPGTGNPGWSARLAARPSYRFRNRRAPEGIATARSIDLRQGKLLKLVVKDTGLALTSPQGAIGIRVTVGSQRSCALFDAATIVTDEPGAFLAKHALAAHLIDCADESLGLPPPPPCGGLWPFKCTGACAGDGVCAAGFGGCQCFSPSTPCGGTAPACLGACDPGEACVAVGPGYVPMSCTCVPAGSTACGTPGAPQCGGACESGQVCRSVYAPAPLGGGLGCNCGMPGACGDGGLECPPGFACALTLPNSYACRPIACSGGEYPTCDGPCGAGVCQGMTTPELGAICVCVPGSCGNAGDVGNELGVGRYCDTAGDCAGFAASVCAFAVDASLPHVCIVAPCDGTTNCGAGATCTCNALGCGCLPDACL